MERAGVRCENFNSVTNIKNLTSMQDFLDGIAMMINVRLSDSMHADALLLFLYKRLPNAKQ